LLIVLVNIDFTKYSSTNFNKKTTIIILPDKQLSLKYMNTYNGKRIESCIRTIAEGIDCEKALVHPYALIASKGSLILFYVYCYRHFKKSSFQETALELMENSIEEINSKPMDCSLAKGYSGFGWLLQHLIKIRFLSQTEGQILNELDEIIYESLDIDHVGNNYDLLYGLIGKGVYFMERDSSALKKKALDKIVNILYEISLKDKPNCLYWLDPISIEHDDTRNSNNLYNLGLAHGMASIISFLSLLYKESSQRKLLSEMIEKSTNWLFEQTIYNRESIFPVFSNEQESSRLAWCQGDLGILKALEDVGQFVSNKSLKLLKNSIVEKIIERDFMSAFIDHDSDFLDITFCHGTSGIFHMMNRMGGDTSKTNQKLSQRSHYWLNLTLNSLEKNVEKHPTGVVASVYDQASKKFKWVEDYGIIQGASGVGLVLLSVINPEFNHWDKFLLTSNHGL
jgi:lantibiotic biosynthesis protein